MDDEYEDEHGIEYRLLSELDEIVHRAGQRPRMKRYRSRLPWKTVLSVLVGLSAVVAAATLFTHTFPIVSTSPTVITSVCGGATLAKVAASPTDPPIVGTPGYVTFNCGSTNPGFHVAAAGSVTPTFTLGTGYTALWRVNATQSPTPLQSTCTAAFSTAASLVSGTAVSFVTGDVGKNWNYCADFTSAPSGGFGSFVLTWSQ
jgi:hypothetical protein